MFLFRFHEVKFKRLNVVFRSRRLDNHRVHEQSCRNDPAPFVSTPYVLQLSRRYDLHQLIGIDEQHVGCFQINYATRWFFAA
jgi:hypothetical protein